MSDKYTLKPSLTETFKGIIWKVETDDQNSIVAIESRDVANRLTHFSAFDYKSGQTLFQEITVEEGWFWSLDRVHEGYTYLHSYMNEGSPEHKGIIAIGPNGKIEWQQFNKTLHEVAEGGLVIYNPKIQPKMFELVTPHSGDVISANLKDFDPVRRNVIVPDFVDNVSELSGMLPENNVGPIFYSRINDKQIVACHIRKGELFHQQLLIFQQGSSVLEDFLATDIQKLNPEAFFIEQNHLFYIRHKREFVSYLV